MPDDNLMMRADAQWSRTLAAAESHRGGGRVARGWLGVFIRTPEPVMRQVQVLELLFQEEIFFAGLL
jgi:hypothetical protein